jgi:hypothetical protein
MKHSKALIKFFFGLFFIFHFTAAYSQSIAVGDIYTKGVEMTPSIAAKLTRIELVKLEKYVVLDEFDMRSAMNGDSSFVDCYGKECLVRLGKKLEVDKILSGSFEVVGKKIVVTLKLIDVKSGTLKMTNSIEFADQSSELSRMVEITLREMHSMPVNIETKKRLGFEEEIITAANIGRINNSGPRFGVSAAALGEMNKFFQRKTYNGGLDIYPIVSNIGYQFEVQYIGTENFSALFEVIPNIGGMEQGQFIPSISFLNGFRVGQQGWELAFGPAFGLRKVKSGVYLYPNSEHDGEFYDEQEWFNKEYETWSANPENVDQTTGQWLPGRTFEAPSEDEFSNHLHKNGITEFNASWVMGIGRTFRKGALNVPFNIYYSGNKYGGMIGASVGFNVVRSKTKINQ